MYADKSIPIKEILNVSRATLFRYVTMPDRYFPYVYLTHVRFPMAYLKEFHGLSPNHVL